MVIASTARKGEASPGPVIFVVLMFLAVIIGFVMFVLPMYRVWSQHKAGEAELSKAEYTKRITVEEAKAKLESSKLLAEAELERAKGAAAAMEAIQSKLTRDYIDYLWVTELGYAEKAGTTVIYVPTEANLPIFAEAGRGRASPVAPKQEPKK